MPGRGGRRIIPIRERAGTKFRSVGVHPLVAHYQQANVIWASCQTGKINTGTLPPLVRPTPISAGLPGLTDDSKEIFRLARLADKERDRLLKDKLKSQKGLQNIGVTIAGGLILAVFVLPALTAGPIIVGSTTATTLAGGAGVAEGLMALPLGATVGLAVDTSTPAMTGIPSVHGKATPPKSASFKPMQFVKFSKPCGN